MRIGPLELQEDLSPADWIIDRIHDFAVDVGSVIPEGFEAYARLFHPAIRFENGHQVEVRWSDVATVKGRTIHPEMQWASIAGTWGHAQQKSGGLWDLEPEDGSLPHRYAKHLRDLLAGYTSTKDRVWFAVWDGFAGLKIRPGGTATLSFGSEGIQHAAQRPAPAPGPTLRLPNREYYLLSGPMEGIGESMCHGPRWQSANLWWPDDRSWCVATEIDFSWTYVGGDASLVEALIIDPNLEILPAKIDDGISFESDRINPQPPR